MKFKISIIIPCFNNFNFTKSCLKDLSKLSDDNEIILVDNGSTDDTKKITELNIDLPKNFKYIKNETNLGFAKASNLGFINSEGEYIIFLNNDIRVEKNHANWTSILTEAASDFSIVGPTGGLLNENLDFIRESNFYIDSDYFYISGWCLCAKKELFEKLIVFPNVGPFEENFVTYFEDTDLSFRAKKMGITIKIVPVPVFHFGKMTSKNIGISNLYLSAKSKFINKWKNK